MRETKMDHYSIMLWALVVALCSISFLLLIRLHNKKSKPSKPKLPPGPASLPVVGSLFRLGRRPHESLAELAQEYGPLMTLKLGQVTTIVASSPATARLVLQKHDHSLAGREVTDSLQLLDYPNSSMAMSQPNQHWRRLRTICNSHIFTPRRLDANQHLRRLKVEELLAYIQEKSLAGEAVEIVGVVFVTVLNLIANTVFSLDLVSLNSDSAQDFNQLVWSMMEEAGKPNLANYFPWLKPFDPLGIKRRMTAYFQILHDILDKMIDERMKPQQSSPESCAKGDFLDVLLEQMPDGAVNRHPIKCLLTDIFVAGTDTNSSTLEWAMAEMLRNPEAMAKTKMELQQTIQKSKPIEESDIASLPYLQAVVKETLRLHPPAPLLLPHRAESDVEIGAFMIPKGSQVLVNAWAIGRDPDLWVNPTSFMPERFLNSSKDYKGQDFDFIPFGSGRRICPGLPLAHRMVHLLLASLLHSFDWKLPSEIAPKDIDMSPKIGLTLRKAIPLYAIPIRH